MNKDPQWPVVRFIITATGFTKEKARELIDEIPPEKYSELFLRAHAWDRDVANRASEQFAQIIGGGSLQTLIAETAKARIPQRGLAAQGRASKRRKKA